MDRAIRTLGPAEGWLERFQSFDRLIPVSLELWAARSRRAWSMKESNPAAPVWEMLAHHSHLYVLPVAGGASLVLGTLATVGMSGEIPRILPFALIIVGASALVGSLASHLCIPRTKEVEHVEPTPPATPEVAGASTTVRAAPARGPDSSWPQSRPHSGIGRATLAELSHVEDELWRRWATPRSAPLGAPLTGPVPETAYSPARPGAHGPFESRDRDVVVLSEVGRSRAGVGRPQTNELAPPARAVASRAVTPRRGFAAPRADIALSARGSAATNETLGARAFAGASIPLLSGRSGGFLDMDVLDHPTYLASIDPSPPRPAPAAGSERESVPGRPGPKSRPAAHRGICSDCSRRLLDFRAWVECRVCRKPMCRDCLQQSFSSGEDGSCSACRASRRRPSAGRGQGRREIGADAEWGRAQDASSNGSAVRVSRARPGPT